ncbi:nucleotide exchange factor GrpE [Herbiconiux sp. L3-i23]|uniref:nucleotide exchange factor GrpE n=1 Tax=Herbiconiux sp. L3-i23 TaxID=2905871 RepID=UPI00205177BF|nr:nucleotide exchange factor GrpE [Herbiconiux sp. L3-i23]BDI24143.1 protein GrpE [Herbiconiux sp. L3-i23]
MAPKEEEDPKDRSPQQDGADDAENTASSAPAEPGFVSMEGPDIETPTGGAAPDAGGADEDGGFSQEDLSFLEDVSSGTASAEEAESAESVHLADLKRVSAEYANYRRRTEANRQIERDRAVGDVVKLLLPVLDDLDRAEKHGDLAEGGPLTTIASKLRGSTERIGLVGFGEPGEAFDPTQHEAIFQKPNPEVTAPTVADVVERGYRIGDVTLRAAKVVVDTPSE